MIDANGILDTILDANRLKRLPRIGWSLRGVARPESIADHMYGMAFVAMLLADLDPAGANRERVLRIALVHDLAESLVTDLPATLARFLPPDVKHNAERAALAEIFAALPVPGDYLALWEEYDAGQTVEARLVRDADKLEVLLQAFVYERSGYRNLDEFWDNYSESTFTSPVAVQLYTALLQRRRALFGDP